MKKKKELIILLVIFLIIAFFLYFNFFKIKGVEIIKEKNCFTIEELEVRGDSLIGIVESGETIKLFKNYYDCNEVKRDDLVVYNYSGRETLILKRVKAIQGDNFSLRKVKEGWNIFVNQEILVNSEALPYILNQKKYLLLFSYEQSYGGIIPKERYLILGNSVYGSLDSTHFGLVHKKDIIGKAEIMK